MKPIEWVYLAFALIGLVAPWAFNITWMLGDPTPGALGFLVDATANPAASSISIDIVIACTTFFVWMMAESRRLKMKRTWLLIPYALMGSFASAFPLFLFLRSRRCRALESA